MKLTLNINEDRFELGHMDLPKLIHELDDYYGNEPLFEALAKHPDPVVRSAVSSKKNLSQNAVMLLAKDKGVVRIQENLVLRHLESPGLSYMDVVYFLQSGIPEWTFEIALCLDRLKLESDEIQSIVAMLVHDASPYVRAAVATKKAVSDEMMQILANDPFNMVSRLAVQSLENRGFTVATKDIAQVERAFKPIIGLLLDSYQEILESCGTIPDSEQAEESRTTDKGIKYGIEPIDAITGGIGDRETVFFVGSDSAVNTSLALNVAMNIGCSKREHGNSVNQVAVVSFQYSDIELVKRILSVRAHVSDELMHDGKLSHEQIGAIASSSGEIAESGLHIMGGRDMTLQSALAGLKMLHGSVDSLCLVVIDGLEHLVEGEAEVNLASLIEENAHLIKRMGNELGVSVILTMAIPDLENADAVSFKNGIYKNYHDAADSVFLAHESEPAPLLTVIKHAEDHCP